MVVKKDWLFGNFWFQPKQFEAIYQTLHRFLIISPENPFYVCSQVAHPSIAHTNRVRVHSSFLWCYVFFSFTFFFSSIWFSYINQYTQTLNICRYWAVHVCGCVCVCVHTSEYFINSISFCLYFIFCNIYTDTHANVFHMPDYMGMFVYLKPWGKTNWWVRTQIETFEL